MAVDPAADSAIPENPQTWNRYTYAFNNPLNLMDPDGATPYHCSRPTDAGIGRHGFIVANASGVGKGGQVHSYGESKFLGPMGKVTSQTKSGLSKGTAEGDKAAWKTAGSPGSDTKWVEIKAPDATVESLADSVMQTDDYEMVPLGPNGLNSNSASTAIAQEASGTCNVLPAGGSGMVGASRANDVRFDQNADGKADTRKTPCDPPPGPRPLDDR